MEKYDHSKIEHKWQEKWDKEGLYRTGEDKNKPKYYILDMFPYPSGAGLHVGHPKGYIATDIFARTKKMQGYNVLHPMGWDAFGLPAENYAIKNKVHPRAATEKNIATFKSQLAKLGFSYDWEREINTTDPKFYKWTQWIFLQMFKKGLAYESNEPIIWCPSCKTGLANEDLEGGRCERCGSEVERRPMRQWVLKITDYADRLLYDLDKLPDWEASIKEMQRHWIGRSEGARVKFRMTTCLPARQDDELRINEEIDVFTTRPDTLFGCTYFVLAPEHTLVEKLKDEIKNWNEVNEYINNAAKKSDLDRTELNKEKTGVKLEGIMAVNPVNNEQIPVFIADYVMMGYGTGAIMAVPAHDERDHEFAEKYGLPIKEVVQKAGNNDPLFTGDGIAVNSGFLDGLETIEAKKVMIEWLKKKGLGEKAVNYKLKDWVFSRQRYWGEPIPIVHCGKCGPVAVPEEELPLALPEVERYEPTGTGESPLANIHEWVNTKCPRCGGPGKRETNTMPQWAGSSWYYLRFIDPDNDEALVDKGKDKYWSPVDFYVGGAEHATRHLIYSRFWHKFLYDIGSVNYEEPYTRLQHVGLILAEDGRKMSKRWGNVINPDDVVRDYGADAMRVYEMFMGPFSQACSWSTNGLSGARKFLERIWKMRERISEKAGGVEDKNIESLLHKTVKKVGEDIEGFKLNTAVSAMMILVNEMEKQAGISRESYEKLLLILFPFAPHITEELWHALGHNSGIFGESWPEYDKNKVVDEIVKLVVQVNGKLRDMIEVPADISEDEAKEKAMKSDKVKKWVDGKKIIKIIFVKSKLLNIVVK